jgi:flagellar biosynthesis/type III secretory pathway ATPase
MMLHETDGHAQPVKQAWAANIERRIAEVEQNGEQRVLILRDALADFAAAQLAQRDNEIALLKKHITELEQKLQQKSEVDVRVEEVIKRLDARQLARDEAKRGPKGERGERGARGRHRSGRRRHAAGAM